MAQILECVPNFSEGRDLSIIKQITDVIESVDGVKLLDVDPGAATNRTVVTFVGEPAPVIEAAYLAIRKASELIDMSKHSGEHPRMGATDVCPLVPVAGITLEEAADWARKLGARCADLGIPIYLYEAAASEPKRKNLATVRAGEYEGLEAKVTHPEWQPDFGPAVHNARAGATAIGARDFLIAYNVNLNTASVRRANSVAFDIREKGRIKRVGNAVTGAVLNDAEGNPQREPGLCKGVKAIGWYIEEYGLAQISMNITDTKATKLHEAFEHCRASATKRGMRVTGSELVGLVPLQVMLDTGRYYLQQQGRSTGIAEREILHIAVKSLGLDELAPFDIDKKIIEYQLRPAQDTLLAGRTLTDFAELTASESPAPGGGSISAYIGTLGVALGTMVANLSAHKRGWDDRVDYFSSVADRGQRILSSLLHLVDADTAAFNGIIDAVRMPKATDAERSARKVAMDQATEHAIEVPLQIMRVASEAFDINEEMAAKGNPNSVSDAGVGALACRAAVYGAYLNVLINCADYENKEYVDAVMAEADTMLKAAHEREASILSAVKAVIRS